MTRRTDPVPRASPLPRLLPRPRQLWDRLVEPSPALAEPEHRRRARLLLALLASVIPLALVASTLVPILTQPGFDPLRDRGAWVGLACAAALLVAYALTRTERYMRGAWLTVLVAVAGAWTATLVQRGTHTEFEQLYFLPLAVLLSSMLLSFRHTLWLAVVNIAAVGLYPLLDPTVDGTELIVPLIFLALASMFVGVGAAIHQTDLAQIREQSRRLQESEERLRGLTEVAFEGIAVHEGGRILELNQAFARLFGYEPRELVGASVLDLTAPEERAKMLERLRRPSTRPYELRGRRKDGSEVVLEIAAKDCAYQGRPARVVAVRDITERKRTESELKGALSLLGATLESTADGILVTDREGRHKTWNRKFAEMWRIPEAALAAGDDHEVLRAALAQVKDPEAFARAALANPEEETADVVEFTDGRVFERHSKPQRVGDAIVGRVWSFRDVTGRIVAERRLVELKNFNQEIVDNVPAGVLYLDPAGVITYENKYLLHALGAKDGESPRGWFDNIFDLPTLQDHPEFLAKVRLLLAGEPFRDHELVYRTLYGRGTVLSMSGVPIFDSSPDGGRGAVKGGILLVHDVTEQKRAEAELEASRKQVAMSEKLSALGTLVAGVAHEINNPLAFMKGTVDLTREELEEALADGRLTPAAREAVAGALANQDVVLEGIARIGHITASLKRVARAGNGARGPEDVNALAESVLTVASPRIPKSVRVRRDLRATRSAHANGSEVSQVLLNLVLNAADAMAARESGELTVRAFDEGARVVVEVEDTGPGIPPAQQAKIFTPFFTTKSHGTGLGLSVSYRIVEDHGGRLSFTSEPGRGTTFRVELPASA